MTTITPGYTNDLTDPSSRTGFVDVLEWNRKRKPWSFWEVKPLSAYGIRYGKEQVDHYVKRANEQAGWDCRALR